jgi:hypothetical protein
VIISNAIPKAGGHLLYAYLGACGLKKEPGELYADVDVDGDGRACRREVTGSQKDIWDGIAVRDPETMLADMERKAVINAHVHDKIDLSGHAVAFMYRNPRNLLYSYARFSAADFNWNPPVREPSDKAVRSRMQPSYMRQIVGQCRCFYGWLSKSDIAVKFEDFIADPDTTGKAIAAALGIGFADPSMVIGESTPWVTLRYRGTWSGQLSDWRQVWNDRLDAQWRAAGGYEVEAGYGYKNKC